MEWPNFGRLNIWVWRRNQRLQKYLKSEEREYEDVLDRHHEEYAANSRQIDADLFHEGREGINWLENREIRLSAVVLKVQRALIEARIEIRKRLGQECRQLLSDAELSKLQETMLRILHVARFSRREDYERRAKAAGIPARRPEQSDAAEYGDLEALVRREVEKLSLNASLKRPAKPTTTTSGER